MYVIRWSVLDIEREMAVYSTIAFQNKLDYKNWMSE